MDRLKLAVNKELLLKHVNQINRRHVLIAGGALGLLWIAYRVKKWYSFKRYFKRMNIQGPEPSPILGNISQLIKLGLPYFDVQLARDYGRIFGVFEGSVPVIMTTDINFIRCMLIRDFNSFANRRTFDAFDVEPTNKFISNLRDDEWKNVRAILSTSFTTGKIKAMSKCMEVCARNFIEHFEGLVQKDPKIDIRKAFGCYSLDVIASCCFGMDTNSIKDQESPFIKNLQIILSNTLETNPAFLLIAFFPKFAGFLSKNNLLEFFPKKNFKVLSDFTLDIIEKRKTKEHAPREDFIQNMIEHQENEATQEKQATIAINPVDKANSGGKWNTPLKKTISNAEIVSQAIIFLIAGFETTAINLGFIAYNLAKNPECQDQLCAEIDDILHKYDGQVNYDSISEMKYMEAVIDETLRMYPPAQRIEREVTNDIDYNGLKLKKGQVVMVPIYALHHDTDLYPEPERFKPERFLKESFECKSRDSMAFLPFGGGPRGCLGMRFAMIETKILLAAVLAKFRFVTCPETPEKITLDSSGFSRSMSPIYVSIEKR